MIPIAQIAAVIGLLTACVAFVVACIRCTTAIVGTARHLNRILDEHDMMWEEFCARHNIPTRNLRHRTSNKANGAAATA